MLMSMSIGELLSSLRGLLGPALVMLLLSLFSSSIVSSSSSSFASFFFFSSAAASRSSSSFLCFSSSTIFLTSSRKCSISAFSSSWLTELCSPCSSRSLSIFSIWSSDSFMDPSLSVPASCSRICFNSSRIWSSSLLRLSCWDPSFSFNVSSLWWRARSSADCTLPLACLAASLRRASASFKASCWFSESPCDSTRAPCRACRAFFRAACVFRVIFTECRATRCAMRAASSAESAASLAVCAFRASAPASGSSFGSVLLCCNKEVAPVSTSEAGQASSASNTPKSEGLNVLAGAMS
mmetsp:Transcript_129507/g.252161  ORF Transcript_129507/g.252161 Transcript_129507/m.252161 type:complete len:296 (+) Transcript_129507:446-1333(+)